MKHLYIIRHGPAEEPHTFVGGSSDIPLSKEGKKLIEDEVVGMKHLGIALDLILSSPLARAHQTAQLIAKKLNHKKKSSPGIPIEICKELATGVSRTELVRTLEGYKKFESVLLVGHQPHLGSLAGALVTGLSHSHFGFKKGALCLIKVDDKPVVGHGELLWFLLPEQLQLIGKK